MAAAETRPVATATLRDVGFLGIFDRNKELFYSLNYDDISSSELMSSVLSDTSSISVLNDQPLFVFRQNDIFVALLASENSNELFVKNAFDALIENLSRLIKTWSPERIFEKYDQIVLLCNEFLFQKIILVDQPKELGDRLMKRSFESIAALKVNKGFASFLNKTAKSFRKG